MKQPRYPSLYQVNTRVWLTALSQQLNRSVTLDDIPDTALDEFVRLGFDWIWLLSVWTTGERAQKISRENPGWRIEFEETLPDLKEEDIEGSGFAIAGYHVHPPLGGDEALKRLRDRLKKRGLKLMLDFVPNHMGPDHPWVHDHPEYFVQGTPDDLENHPLNYTNLKFGTEEWIVAYGRDPYFTGWPDTLQLDYSNPAVVEAMKFELLRISTQCDGVRCDMAMVILPEIFEKTWSRKALPFWPIVTKTIHDNNPNFIFMAEVYWDMEWRLQQEGFDYTYDKRLYDRLVEGYARTVREHFHAAPDYQDKMVRFLENHDEARAAAKFDRLQHEAAAMITFLSPGLRFFHQGQLEGREKRISPHLVRAPKEEINVDLQKFYAALLEVMKKPLFRDGQWGLPECVAAWDGNDTWDSFIAFLWEGKGERAIIAVNYSSQQGQCYIRLPFAELMDKQWHLNDLMNPISYEREGDDLVKKGLYLDVGPWTYHVFEMKKYAVYVNVPTSKKEIHASGNP
jgi:hypothetical protein